MRSGSEVPRIHLPHTWLNRPLCRARRGAALRRESSILFLQMEPLFALCPCGVSLPTRGDCSPLGGILTRLVGCISLDITRHPRSFIIYCASTPHRLLSSSVVFSVDCTLLHIVVSGSASTLGIWY